MINLLASMLGSKSDSELLHNVSLKVGEGIFQYRNEILDTLKISQDFDLFDLVDKNYANSQGIEDILGTGFVLHQTSLTRVISKIIRIYKLADENNYKLDKKFSNKFELMKLCSSLVVNEIKDIEEDKLIDSLLYEQYKPIKLKYQPKYTQIEVINAAANLFKHSSEWGPSWKKIVSNNNKKDKGTISTIVCVSSFGCHYTNSNNQKILFKAINQDNDYHRLELLSNVVNLWKEDVLLELKQDLADKGVINLL